MAEESRQPAAPLPVLRRLGALGLPIFALAALLFWVALAGPRRGDFAVLPVILLLALLAPCWPGPDRRTEHLLRAGTGLVAALILGLDLLSRQGTGDRALTIALFLVLMAGVTFVLQVVFAPRPALGLVLAMLAVLAGLGLGRGADAGRVLGWALGTMIPWVLLALVAVGVGALVAFERRWLQVAVYALAIAGLAGYWQWGGPLAFLATIPGGLDPLEVRAAGLIPACILIGGAAQIALALLLPHVPWTRTAQADLGAHLALIGFPLVAALLPIRARLAFEGDFRMAWLAWFLVVLLFARLAVAGRFLLRAASAPTEADFVSGAPKEREAQAVRAAGLRLALAFLIVCCAAYWPAILWRAASYGLVGDEPQYLAATMSLWNNQDLELADSMFSPQMTAVLADPQGERDLHVYEDASADRMLFSRNFGPANQSLFLPLVAAPGSDQDRTRGLSSTIELMNAGLESAGGEVVFHDAAGKAVQTQPVVVGPGRSLTVESPVNPTGPLSATVNVGKPISVAARAQDRDGSTEMLFGSVVTPRHCIPLQLDPARWHARAFVQNGLPTETGVTWTSYDRDGATRDQGKLTLPPDGLAALPVPLSADPGTLCFAADGPVATLLLAQASPGLLIQQSNPARDGRIDIPQRHITLGYFGSRRVLIYNNAADPITLTLDREGGAKGQEIPVPAHGTWAYDIDDRSATITSQDPVMVSEIETIGLHAAAVTPEQTASPSLVIPVIDVGAVYYAVSQIELTNLGAGDLQANATLLDANGRTIWRDNIWVPAGTTLSKPFWYEGADSRYLTVEARGPLTATLLQREIRTARPVHGLGLSLALLPGYGLAGYQGVLATVALLAALLALTLYDLLRRLGLDARAAVIVAGLVAGSSPLAPAAVRLYAEVGGTLLIALALICVDNWRTGRWPVIVAAPLGLACLGGAILFHGRLLPLALVVAASAVCLVLARAFEGRGRWSWRRWLLGAGVIAAGMAVLAALLAFGPALDPRLRLGYVRDFLVLAKFGPQSLGILFDRASGLFPAAPVLLLAGGGFVPAIRRAPYLGWTALVLCLAQFAAVALREGGWETWGPPGRYILPAVPFLALGLGAAWCWGFARPVRLLALFLGAIGLLVTAFSWWLPLGLHYGIAAPTAYWFADVALPPLLGANPFRLFPQLTSISTIPVRAILPWLALLALGVLLGLPWQRIRRDSAAAQDEHARMQPARRDA